MTSGDKIFVSLISSLMMCVSQYSPALSLLLPSLEKNTGLIFYPGAFVDPKRYSPMARAIAMSLDTIRRYCTFYCIVDFALY